MKKKEKLITKLVLVKKTAMFQCWLDSELLNRVRKQRRADNVKWRELIEACFRLYLEESAKR